MSAAVDRVQRAPVSFARDRIAPGFAAWNAPTALADRLRSGYGGIHVWSFATTAAGQSISVFCTVVHRAGLSDADQQAQIRRAGLEFWDILRRISIQPR